ncbi:methyltransferase domain-containing protein [Glycomyces halotolerans]
MSNGSPSETSAAIDFGEAVAMFRERAEAESERYRRQAERLSSPDDAVMLDVGCGAAGMALALAESHPQARVFAVDSHPDMVELARQRAAETGLAVDTAVVDLNDLGALADLIPQPADLVWAGGVIHHAADQQAVLDDLSGILAPGGRLALGEGGIAPRYLPWDIGIGRPGLELRLAEAWSRRMEAENAAHKATPLPYGWNVALERAGLTEVREFNDVVALPAPLEGEALDSTLKALAARVAWFQDFLDGEDQSTWEALLDPDSPHWLGARRDLHHLEIRSTYVGVKR